METREMYDKMVVEYGDDTSTHPQFDPKLWEEVIGPHQHGGFYGQGVLGKVIGKSVSEGSDAASGAPSVQFVETELDQVAKRVTDQLLERFNCDDPVTKRVTDQLMERLSSNDEVAKLVMEQLVKHLSSDAISKDALCKMVEKKIDKKLQKVKKAYKKK